MQNFGTFLKDHRLERGYTLQYVQEKTGISNQNLSRWENDKAIPGIDFCMQLAKFYGCTLDELVGLYDNDTGEYENNNSSPTKIPSHAITFAKDFGDILTDKNYIEMSKLYKAITPELRALILGYAIGILQRNNVDTVKIIGY